MAYTAPFNLTGHPVATVPMRRRDGLSPAGLQIVGHRGHDNEAEHDQMLRAARDAEEKDPTEKTDR